MSTVFATDAEAIGACPRDLAIKALRGFAIVWFLPYRRTAGLIETPDNAQPQSVEAIIIHDASEHALDPGVMVGVSRQAGTYFEFQGHRLCTVPGSALVLVNTGFSPEATVEDQLRELHELIAKGRGDSEEADAIREEMATAYKGMSSSDEDRLNQLSEDLYIRLAGAASGGFPA